MTTGLMRTTLDLNDDLLAEAKALAACERLTLTRLIEEGLTLRLRRGCPPAPTGVVIRPLPVHAGQGGLAPAVVDPRSNRCLMDAADGTPPG